MTIPGVGEMLGLVILYETHDIGRFDTVQRYSSYCGVVKCERRSANKIIAAKRTDPKKGCVRISLPNHPQKDWQSTG